MDRRFIQVQVGHECDSSTAIYTHVSDDFMNTALRKALAPAFEEPDRREGAVMTRRLDYKWNLRQVMAGRGMFATTDLIGPLAQRKIRLSSSQVYRLVAERPERLSLKVLMALLDILDCSMEDLIEPAAEPGAGAGRKKKAAGAEAGDRRAAAPPGPHSRDAVTVDTAHHDRAMSDPAGLITQLVMEAGPGLGREQVRGAVSAVAGGRAKSRRLALALAGRPEVLADGRSPAPRAVADLLVALHDAGSRETSLPACAQCGRKVRGFQRAGQDWYCSPCAPDARRAVRRLRREPDRRLPGPGRPAAVREVPGRRRT